MAVNWCYMQPVKGLSVFSPGEEFDDFVNATGRPIMLYPHKRLEEHCRRFAAEYGPVNFEERTSFDSSRKTFGFSARKSTFKNRLTISDEAADRRQNSVVLCRSKETVEKRGRE